MRWISQNYSNVLVDKHAQASFKDLIFQTGFERRNCTTLNTKLDRKEAKKGEISTVMSGQEKVKLKKELQIINQGM